jgi:hypothetical protein
MERTYDVFERLPDGTMLWKCAAVGHEEAIRKLKELAGRGVNEFRLMHVATNTVIAAMNARKENAEA